MSPSTPSALKWLIDKQVRLKGQLIRKDEQLNALKKQLSTCRREIRELEGHLATIEGAMRLHEIQINPADLRPVKPHYNGRVISHGAMTRIIRRTLAASPDRMTATRNILSAILQEMSTPVDKEEKDRILQQLRVRLCIMAKQGDLIKHSPEDFSAPRLWQLPAWYEDEA